MNSLCHPLGKNQDSSACRERGCCGSQRGKSQQGMRAEQSYIHLERENTFDKISSACNLYWALSRERFQRC